MLAFCDFPDEIFGKNIGVLCDFAGILVKLHASLGICGKILNLYIVEKINKYQYVEI